MRAQAITVAILTKGTLPRTAKHVQFAAPRAHTHTHKHRNARTHTHTVLPKLAQNLRKCASIKTTSLLAKAQLFFFAAVAKLGGGGMYAGHCRCGSPGSMTASPCHHCGLQPSPFLKRAARNHAALWPNG
jgi:hypothetical protein